MSITKATLSGGFVDDDATDPPNTLNSVYEYSNFVDKISVDLTSGDPLVPYATINKLFANVSINGVPISFNELTANGAVSLNVPYNSPNTNSVSILNIVTSIESSNTVGNIYITGNIQNAFPDKYWEYNDFTSNTITVVDSPANIPNTDVGLFTYKPSFMRHINIDFAVTAHYDSATENKTIFKKVYNDWEINRLALLAQISRENSYRSNNYPKTYT